jgi:tRNA(Ser,Leu) C12 N-acetylase TAN1
MQISLQEGHFPLPWSLLKVTDRRSLSNQISSFSPTTADEIRPDFKIGGNPRQVQPKSDRNRKAHPGWFFRGASWAIEWAEIISGVSSQDLEKDQFFVAILAHLVGSHAANFLRQPLAALDRTLVKDWNTIVTIYQQGFRRAMRALQGIGPTDRTPYYNVLIMKIEDPVAALETIERLTQERAALYDAIARVAPAQFTFDFQSLEEFTDHAKSFLLGLVPKLAGRSFHVRLHRRGWKFDLQTPEAERLFDDFVVAATAKSGTPARITFAEPDAVIVIDTIDGRAGIAMWAHEDLVRYRLLRPD